MKHFIILILFVSSFVFAQDIKKNEILAKEEPISSAGLIEKSYYVKKIDLDQRVLYLAYYLNDFSKLPDKYKSSAPEKCGTWILKIIYFNISKLKKIHNKLYHPMVLKN